MTYADQMLDDQAPQSPAATDAAVEALAPPRLQLDEISRVLLRIALMLITVILATTLALLVYLSTLNRTPRTALERDVAQWETAVKERADDPAGWTRLAYAYAEAGRTDDALDAVRRGEKATGKATLRLVRADVLRTAGRYREALAAYTDAETAIKAAERQADERRKKVEVFVPIDRSSLGTVYFGRGLCRKELGDLNAARADLQRAAEVLPDQTNILVALGDVQAELGEKEKAREAYEAALRFVPDDESARRGLSRLRGEAE